MVDEGHHDTKDHVENADDDGNFHLVAVLEGDLVDGNLQESDGRKVRSWEARRREEGEDKSDRKLKERQSKTT